MDYFIGPGGELYHWGIKGMRWGQRRYQNKDGSLTPAGKKRYAREEAQLKERERIIKNREREAAKRAKLDAKKAELDARENALDGGTAAPKQEKKRLFGKKSKDGDTSKQKSVKDYSNDELRELTNRMQLEKNFLEAQRNLSSMTPQKVGAGKQFMDKYGETLIKSVVVDPAQKYIAKALEKKLGLEDKDTLSKLERMWKEADYRKKIAEANRDAKKANKPDKPDDDELAKLEREWKIADYNDKIRKASGSTKSDRTPDDLIDYLSSLDGDELAKLETASGRAKQYKDIVDLLKKEKDSDKK